MEGVPEESITCPDLLFLPDTKQWLSFQVAAHDFVPSKNEMATTLYADSRLVKFDIPRNRAPKTWLTVDTASTASKNIPVRLFEAAEWIKIGSPVQGPYPQAFKTFVAERDAKLVDLQNKCLCEQIKFLWLRQHHHTVFLPKPVKALQTWSAQGTDKITWKSQQAGPAMTSSNKSRTQLSRTTRRRTTQYRLRCTTTSSKHCRLSAGWQRGWAVLSSRSRSSCQ